MNTNADETPQAILKRIRRLLLFFIVGLVISGATALPLETELNLIVQFAGWTGGTESSGLARWILRVRDGLVETNARHPFIAYGTDWLAFAHFVIAVAFIGPWRDPVRNRWVIEFGMIACALVVPFALIAGSYRCIPFGWRLIDCSFGVFGIIPVWYCWKLIRRLEGLGSKLEQT